MLLTDENMIVDRVNYTMMEMLHREYARIIDQPIGLALGCINNNNSDEGCGFGPACSECLLKKAMYSVLESGQSVKEIEIHPTLQLDNRQIKPWFCISVKPVIVGGCKHLIVAINDITQRKRAEEELKETMELKSQFISTISHELRTPLTGMIEGIAIVLEEVAGPVNQKQMKFLRIAKRNADRLSILINDVLDFQRLGAGKMKLDIRSHNINEVLTEVQETMTLYAEKNSIEMSFVSSDDLSKAEFDRAKMIQVLTNLVSNAVKFTPEKGRASVIVQRRDVNWTISVSDTGMGIPKEELSKIFDPFYRANRRGEHIQGTGLGLAIVNKIIKLHGGRIEVESQIGQGTTFTIFLPLEFKKTQESSPETVDKLLEYTVATSS
jgi:signal transduction histidine kinase